MGNINLDKKYYEKGNPIYEYFQLNLLKVTEQVRGSQTIMKIKGILSTTDKIVTMLLD